MSKTAELEKAAKELDSLVDNDKDKSEGGTVVKMLNRILKSMGLDDENDKADKIKKAGDESGGEKGRTHVTHAKGEASGSESDDAEDFDPDDDDDMDEEREMGGDDDSRRARMGKSEAALAPDFEDGDETYEPMTVEQFDAMVGARVSKSERVLLAQINSLRKSVEANQARMDMVLGALAKSQLHLVKSMDTLPAGTMPHPGIIGATIGLRNDSNGTEPKIDRSDLLVKLEKAVVDDQLDSSVLLELDRQRTPEQLNAFVKRLPETVCKSYSIERPASK